MSFWKQHYINRSEQIQKILSGGDRSESEKKTWLGGEYFETALKMPHTTPLEVPDRRSNCDSTGNCRRLKQWRYRTWEKRRKNTSPPLNFCKQTFSWQHVPWKWSLNFVAQISALCEGLTMPSEQLVWHKKPKDQLQRWPKFALFFDNCGLKTKKTAKVDKSNVDYMFTNHPQIHIGVVQGKVKKEGRKRKLSFPKPQLPKKNQSSRWKRRTDFCFLSLFEVVN